MKDVPTVSSCFGFRSTTLNRFVDEAISYWDLQELYPRICPPTVVRVLDEQRFVEQ